MVGAKLNWTHVTEPLYTRLDVLLNCNSLIIKYPPRCQFNSSSGFVRPRTRWLLGCTPSFGTCSLSAEACPRGAHTTHNPILRLLAKLNNAHSRFCQDATTGAFLVSQKSYLTCPSPTFGLLPFHRWPAQLTLARLSRIALCHRRSGTRTFFNSYLAPPNPHEGWWCERYLTEHEQLTTFTPSF